jgi:alpha-1,3-rhamnosyltransferase
MDPAPLVSVVIPSYNHASHVGDAIASVLSQTESDLELIVVDDGSTDESLAAIRSAIADDIRARLVTHEDGSNRGLVATLQKGIGLASGQFLSVVASDDLWLPRRLERMLYELGSAQAIYCRAFLIDVGGARTGEVIGAIPSDGDIFRQLLIRNVIPAPAVLMTRSAYDATSGYDGAVPYEDLDLMLKLTATAPVRFLNEPLVEYRTSDSGLYESLQRRLGRHGAIRTTIAAASSCAVLDSAHREVARRFLASWTWLEAWERADGSYPAGADGLAELPVLLRAWDDLLPPPLGKLAHGQFLAAVARRSPRAALVVLSLLVRRRLDESLAHRRAIRRARTSAP